MQCRAQRMKKILQPKVPPPKNSLSMMNCDLLQIKHNLQEVAAREELKWIRMCR